ncbi:ABC transporter ATP-binding protein [Desulfobacula sp.]|uniref:ABC transporter ATP-binding protein n=1 Tax=Desulfobacula sp. TaxID=2593537 RepID=UPI001EB8D422|nr:ABC transporter ATP-binding protein [Desulfobacula sp.]
MSDKMMIETKRLNKSYEGMHIIRNISIHVEKGQFVVILGKSGSGKTTLLSLISGLEQPDSGEIVLCGENIENSSEIELAKIRRDKIGFVFQTFNLIPTLSALDNVMLPLIPVKKNHPDLKEKALQIMKYIEIDHRCGHLPSKLSGGERQRVAIARALLNDPEVLFADEPTGNLDTSTGEAVLELLLKLKKERGITIILVTHEKEYINLADRVINIKDGEIENEQI